MGSLNGKNKLYHGTTHFFKEIDLHYAQPFKDFGRGFYLTSFDKQAIRWANKRGSSNYYVYEFDIDVPDNIELRVLPLTRYNNQWLDYVSLNRSTDITTEDFDIVFDKMADNRRKNISSTIQAYLKSKISSEDAIKKLKWPNAKADQYCFKTQAALQCLKLTKCILLPEGKTIISEPESLPVAKNSKEGSL